MFHFRKTHLLGSIVDHLTVLGLYRPDLLALAIFKEASPDNLRIRLRSAGQDVIDLPANPHYMGGGP